MQRHYKHFNAREMLAAATAWEDFHAAGGKMVVSLAGAMSTGELGISLAPLIRAGYIDAISSTAANLEEDFFNLLANKDYHLAPDWRMYDMQKDTELRDQGFNRVTDTCIPEDVMLEMEQALRVYWANAALRGESYFHWEYFYRLIDDRFFEGRNQIPMEDSWVCAAHDMGIPIYTPGTEDSTLGNMFAANVLLGRVSSHSAIRSGTEQFAHMVEWYREMDRQGPIGFFQIGGGIAGDFAMCVVPSILQDLEEQCTQWSYFCHIGDSTTSYGSYSGCPPNEKVTWWKLKPDTPSFTINSDASIVAPLIFTYLLESHERKQEITAVADALTQSRSEMPVSQEAVSTPTI